MFRSISAVALLLASICAPSFSEAASDTDAIVQIARGSKCISHEWPYQRGTAPSSYIEGMALVFARAACHPDRTDVRIVSGPESGQLATDALTVYRQEFSKLGMANDTAGVATLRHTYVLLIGLGMMESSGKFCEGRDISQCFAKANSAESGLFQTSYGVGKSNPVLMSLFADYSAGKSDCLLSSFQGHLTCRIHKSQNAKCPNETSDVTGTGPGADWQRLTKICPAFAADYAAVVLRQHGGSSGEFNPIRKRQAEVFPACDGMLKSVQDYVQAHPDVCAEL